LIKDVIKILYIDDDSDDRELFKEALSEVTTKYQLQLASNGVEAMKMIQEFLPDIIFLDINMPLKSGKECLAEIRKEEKFTNTPVIMISTSVNKIDVEETYQNGANIYAVKQDCFEKHIKLIRLILAMYIHENLWDQARSAFLISDPSKVSRNLKLGLN
jgi:CheY-like chemotaxis protein